MLYPINVAHKDFYNFLWFENSLDPNKRTAKYNWTRITWLRRQLHNYWHLLRYTRNIFLSLIKNYEYKNNNIAVLGENLSFFTDFLKYSTVFFSVMHSLQFFFVGINLNSHSHYQCFHFVNTNKCEVLQTVGNYLEGHLWFYTSDHISIQHKEIHIL